MWEECDEKVRAAFWHGCAVCGIFGAALSGSLFLLALYYIGSTSAF